MKYIQETDTIAISVEEFVRVSMRCISALDETNYDDLFRKNEKRGSVPLSLRFSVGKYSFSLEGFAEGLSDKEVSTSFYVEKNPKGPMAAEIAEARARAFILAYMASESTSCKVMTLSITYKSRLTKDTATVSETVTREKLCRFFDKCKISVSVYARPEIDRVCIRIPSMKKIKFPYPEAREGQGDFIRSVYKTLARATSLLACAPTGTGKTVSVIYPAVKAIADGRVSRVFYLTPKGTTAEAARDCLSLLESSGAIIRSVILTAKEKCCKNGLLCRDSRALCENSKQKRLPDAVMELYDLNITTVTVKEISEVAKKHRVCPYELSLCYSELCDFIICDFNYLFDPSVYIKRFFTEGGDYAFLIDEAHNLPDRTREMYSATLELEELVRVAQSPYFSLPGGFGERLCELNGKIYEILFSAVKDELREKKDGTLEGATHLNEPQVCLIEAIEKLSELFESEIKNALMAKDEDSVTRLRLLRESNLKITSFYEALLRFSNEYRLFVFYTGGSIRAQVFCIDPSRAIAERLSLGHGAVFFSATLTPLWYYKALFGIDGSGECVEVRSPFDPSQLSVSILDRISTRYSERERTLPAILRTVGAVLNAKRGNYMVFCPSFEYCEALGEAFRRKYPKIKVKIQTRDMSPMQRADFLNSFSMHDESYLVGFCVTGGIYSEGIDLVGESLIGAVVVGIGLPSLSYEREAMAEYYEDKYESGKQFAYIYPGMNRVFQAAGRVIRREDDRGVIVLIDDRFSDPIYKKSIPELWCGMKYVREIEELNLRIKSFWNDK